MVSSNFLFWSLIENEIDLQSDGVTSENEGKWNFMWNSNSRRRLNDVIK